MTTPNHLTPDGSITNEGSWSEVQARTEEEWKSGEYDKWASAMSGIPKIGDKLAEIPVIGGALSDFFEIITGIPDSDPNDAGSLVRGFMDGVSSALNGTSNPNIGNAFLTNIWSLLGGIKTVTAEHTAAIAELEAILAASSTTPAYVADVQDMVTIPRSQLIGYGSATVSVSGTTGGGGSMSCADAAHSHSTHTHSFSDSSSHSHPIICPTYKPDRVFTTGSASSYVDYTPIVVDRTGKVKKMRWIVGADTAIFSIDAYYMALMVLNPLNGNLEKVWDSGNIKEGVANTTTLQEVEIDMGINQTCTPGQLLFVAHQQLAPGLAQDSRSFAAVPQAGIARPSSLLVDAPSYRSPSRTAGIPSSTSFAGLTRVNDRIPWAGVSVDTTAA